jgi:hypothetical protein
MHVQVLCEFCVLLFLLYFFFAHGTRHEAWKNHGAGADALSRDGGFRAPAYQNPGMGFLLSPTPDCIHEANSPSGLECTQEAPSNYQHFPASTPPAQQGQEGGARYSVFLLLREMEESESESESEREREQERENFN